MKRLFPIFFLLILCFLSGCLSVERLAGSDNWEQVNLLHINDVYEIAALEGGKTGGMARVSSLRKQLLKESPHTYTLLAGDFLSPSVIGTIKMDGERISGAQMVDIMNQVGVDAACFGNHEFDIKESALQKRLDESDFQWIAGNILHMKDGKAIPFEQKGQELSPYYIFEAFPSFRIGLISTCLPDNQMPYVHYEDIYQSIQKDYEEVAPQVNMVLGLTHLSIGMDRKVAQQLPALPLIMGGHEHKNHREKVGKVVIAKADANAKSAWVHRIFVNKKNDRRIIRSQLVPLNASIQSDPDIELSVQKWEEKAEEAFSKYGIDLKAPVAKLKEPLDGLESSIRQQPTNLGKTIALAMYQSYEGLDAALFNSGSVRLDDYLEGEITQYDIVRTLPFGGGVLKVSLKGSLLKKILDSGMANRGSGGYLQWYNILPRGDQWRVAGQPLDESRIYHIAINDFLLSGREANLDFLTPQHEGIVEVKQAGEGEMARDIRKLLVDLLEEKKNGDGK